MSKLAVVWWERRCCLAGLAAPVVLSRGYCYGAAAVACCCAHSVSFCPGGERRTTVSRGATRSQDACWAVGKPCHSSSLVLEVFHGLVESYDTSAARTGRGEARRDMSLQAAPPRAVFRVGADFMCVRRQNQLLRPPEACRHLMTVLSSRLLTRLLTRWYFMARFSPV